VDGDARLRLFLGFRLPEHVLDHLEAWQRETFGEADVRPLSRQQLHVTLAFLGHRPMRELPSIAEALRASSRLGVPELSASRYRETRSVAMIVLADEGETATRIANDLHGRLERLRVYERETRPWLAHVTVARFRRGPRLRPAVPDLGRFAPSEAAVYHSVLRSTGAQYHVLESVPLGG
jgi:2'-5' RNA ligase